MATFHEQQARRDRTGSWGRGRWLVVGGILLAIAIAVVLIVVYSGGGSGSGGGGY